MGHYNSQTLWESYASIDFESIDDCAFSLYWYSSTTATRCDTNAQEAKFTHVFFDNHFQILNDVHSSKDTTHKWAMGFSAQAVDLNDLLSNYCLLVNQPL